MIRTDRLFWLAALLAGLLGFAAKLPAQGEFGNAPQVTVGSGFEFISDGGGIVSGGAVAFTPTSNLTIGSVTVWLAGYTSSQLPQGLAGGIYANSTNSSQSDQPGTLLIDLNAPKPNDGSLATFTFVNPSPATALLANAKYWLFIYALSGPGFNQPPYPQWVPGTTPVGKAVYKGASSFGAHVFSSSPVTPAFTLNPVPEPGLASVVFLGLSLWGMLSLGRRHGFCRLPVMPRPKRPDCCQRNLSSRAH